MPDNNESTSYSHIEAFQEVSTKRERELIKAYTDRWQELIGLTLQAAAVHPKLEENVRVIDDTADIAVVRDKINKRAPRIAVPNLAQTDHTISGAKKRMRQSRVIERATISDTIIIAETSLENIPLPASMYILPPALIALWSMDVPGDGLRGFRENPPLHAEVFQIVATRLSKRKGHKSLTVQPIGYTQRVWDQDSAEFIGNQGVDIEERWQSTLEYIRARAKRPLRGGGWGQNN